MTNRTRTSQEPTSQGRTNLARRIARGSRWLALPALLLAAGCTHQPSVADTDGTFHDSLRTYANLVRWGELGVASRFVADEERAEFLALAPDLQRLRFTDFDVGPVFFDEGGDTATVKVVYHVYDVRTLVEQRIVEEQSWTSGGRSGWNVSPDLTSFQRVLGIAIEPSGTSGSQAPAKAAPGGSRGTQ